MLSVTTVTHRVDSRVRVDLQCVNVITGVLEEAIVRVQHLMRQQIEPLPAEEHARTRTHTRTHTSMHTSRRRQRGRKKMQILVKSEFRAA